MCYASLSLLKSGDSNVLKLVCVTSICCNISNEQLGPNKKYSIASCKKVISARLCITIETLETKISDLSM